MRAGAEDGRPYVVISADGHCGAALRDYRPYLESRYHDEFDAWADTYADGWAAIEAGPDGRKVGAASFDDSYNWDSAARLARLEAEGVVGEVLFPNTAPPFYPSGAITAPGPRSAREHELRFAGVRAHNRWLADFCAEAPGRRAGIAQVFLGDIPAAVAEARWAREHGLAGILLPADHLLALANLYYPEYDPLWAACADLDLPVGRHGVICAESADAAGPGAPAVGLFEAFWFAQRGIDHLVLGGVFERHPRLRFVTTEVNAAWSVDYARRLDDYAAQARRPGSIPRSFAGAAVDALSLDPSAYVRRQCYFGSFLTEADVAARHQIGLDRLMWGADFPHQEGTTPHTRLALRANFAGVPEDEVRQILGGTAAACYGFDLQALQDVADRVGPTPAEVDLALSPDEWPAYPDESVCSTFGYSTARPSA